MGERWQRLSAEAGRFLAVGLVATIVSLILFNFLVHGFGTMGNAPLNQHAELGYLIANAIGAAISFRGSKTWAFRDRETRHADGGVTAFFVINLGTMLIPMSCLWLSRNILGLDDPLSDNIAANVIGLALANAARFFLFRSYVFRRPRLPFHLNLGRNEIERDLRDATGRSTTDQAPPSAP